MKKFFISIVFICGFFSLQAQQQKSEEVFYYYQEEKIFLTERTDKIFLKLAKRANKNPVLEQQLSTVKTASSYVIQLYNITGSLIKEGRSSGETVIWNLSAFPDGIYVVSVKDSNNKEVSNSKF